MHVENPEIAMKKQSVDGTRDSKKIVRKKTRGKGAKAGTFYEIKVYEFSERTISYRIGIPVRENKVALQDPDCISSSISIYIYTIVQVYTHSINI